jgi:hypothetical protein
MHFCDVVEWCERGQKYLVGLFDIVFRRTR